MQTVPYQNTLGKPRSTSLEDEIINDGLHTCRLFENLVLPSTEIMKLDSCDYAMALLKSIKFLFSCLTLSSVVLLQHIERSFVVDFAIAVIRK